MRVTKTIRAYIRENVEKKLEVKYADLKAQKNEALSMQKELIERAKTAAIEAMKNIFSECHSNLLDYNEEAANSIFRYCGFNNIISLNSDLHWERKMMDEAEKITNDIIVALELGGNKADLDCMLREIGKEEA